MLTTRVRSPPPAAGKGDFGDQNFKMRGGDPPPRRRRDPRGKKRGNGEMEAKIFSTIFWPKIGKKVAF